MHKNYYDSKLNAQKLFMVYETNIPRVEQYLKAEIDYVKKLLKGTENVLELGAGYGRIIKELAPSCTSILGIDISEDNVKLGNEYLKNIPNAKMMVMNIHNLTIKNSFDTILCLQNGLSAMKVTFDTIKNIMNLLSSGGKALFSSYSEKFWDVRLQWFQEQASKGLLGEIDMEKTKNGIIICKDGFQATTASPKYFKEIGELLGYPFEIKEVDESSLFLIIRKDNF
ncbi:class I SAM-dependent methyltransferase [Fusobacterium canifelinum]|uniref:Class I SAM-dependent methyltransferase n=1 Tax=Fusobacterium canifelinum TaxID=285729 RepID=A0A3P1UQT9_9FUSO|nr:class I SAM-dependent methyltransferase [Fusobacterium canifelinum]QQS88179.1 class I SAM-dependent methyltransferase [Fusobacterium canifelinum]RRD22933.1 class I SAM-dependent methyltransferase [Fusobacterium canifelinum]